MNLSDVVLFCARFMVYTENRITKRIIKISAIKRMNNDVNTPSVSFSYVGIHLKLVSMTYSCANVGYISTSTTSFKRSIPERL